MASCKTLGHRVIPQSRATFPAGLEFITRPDKGYSLIDCISMHVRSEGLIDVLTNDRHFEQEGFRAFFRI